MDKVLKKLEKYIKEIEYGRIELSVQKGRVEYIEKTHKEKIKK